MMPRKKMMPVESEVPAALTDLKKSIAGLPEGESKKKARAALKILSEAWAGRAETPKKKSSCLIHTPML
jgi:hypothetical protein